MKTAFVAGASGLVGKELVRKLIDSDQYRHIYIISRRRSGLVHEKIRELVVDFDNLSQLSLDEPIDDAFCTLGTTMKQAGSREEFKKVDYEYIVDFGHLSLLAGATIFLVISSMGADSKSSVFYSRVKGLTEEALTNIGFPHLCILRPSLLLGKRPSLRLTEQLSGLFMKVFNFLIPDNYKAIRAEKVAGYMVKMALKPLGKVTIIKSGEMLRD
jgi:uncharacterized protein YbjT (DUF2867 family)